MSKLILKKNWETAKKDSLGYSDENLVKTYINEFRDNPPWKNLILSSYLDSRFIEASNALSYCTTQLQKKTIRVCDIGGGNGSLAFNYINLIRNINFKWTIYETPEIAEQYQNLTKSQKIKFQTFTDNINSKYDICLLSSSLHYLDDPYLILSNILKKCDYLILLRLPLVDDFEDKSCVQIGVNNLGAKVRVPYWLLSNSKLTNFIKNHGEIIFRWKSSEDINLNKKKIKMHGILFKKIIKKNHQ